MINSKRKGNKNELNLAKTMTEWSGYNFARVPASGGINWGHNILVAGDVICTVEELEWTLVTETKSWGKMPSKINPTGPVMMAFLQAQKDCPPGYTPIVFIRVNGMPIYTWKVYMHIRYFDRPDRIEHDVQYEFFVVNSRLLFHHYTPQELKALQKNGRSAKRN